MGRKSNGWVERLEAAYKEPAETLIPRLIAYYGEVKPLADEAKVTVGAVTRWCKAHGFVRGTVYRKVAKS